MKHAKKSLRPGLLLLAAILLFNPYISTLDFLPDCIAYLFIILALRGVAESVPHFAEAINGAKKMLLITAIKLPAYLFASAYAAADEQLRVIYTLVSFVFAVVEMIWLFPLLRELFAGMDYLAERLGVDSIVTARPGKRMNPLARAKRVAYIALPAKLIIAALPDFTLLSSNEMGGIVTSAGRDLASFRPMFTVLGFIVALGFGIWFLIDFTPLCRTLMRDEKLEQLLGQFREETVKPIPGGERIRRVRYAMWCIAGGAFCMMDVVLDGINYLPDALGILLFGVAVLILRPLSPRRATVTLVTCGIALPLSLATYVTRHLFFAKYSYEALGRIREADALYTTLSVLSSVETAAMIALCVALCALLFVLIGAETGYQADNVNNYSSHLSLHAALRRKAVVMTVLGILSSLATTADVFLRRITERYKQGAADGAGEVLGGVILPAYGWFWLVTFAFCAIWFAYSLYFSSVINSEVEHKYSLT